MPNHRTPASKAKLTGADKNHPERFKARSEPKTSGRGLGKPPAYLPDQAKVAWKTFADELPWLTYEDRAAMEVVSLMRADLMSGKADLPASFFGNYRMALSCLGATPVDRSKVHTPKDEDEDDEFSAFDETTRIQ